ncbi:MAG: DUF6265 family protein [Pseudomonadota bacterium]
MLSPRHRLARMNLLVALALTSAGCVHAVSEQDSTALAHDTDGVALAWLDGCWQTADGVTEEQWTRSVHGDQLFGFSVARNGDQRVFFEMLRIDIDTPVERLHAYPRGNGPTPFEAIDHTPHSITFANDDNDYPQRIRYTRLGATLEGFISLKDGNKPVSWIYQRCDDSS